LRRSIPEVFGNDAPQGEQQRRLVDLALDVGRTLTRFNFPQTEVFNPLGILLARHLTQIDEAQRNATDRTEDNDAVGGEPRQEVADAILAISTSTIAREPPGPEPADDGEQGGENSGAGDGIFVRTFRSIDPNLVEGQIPIDSIRVDFTSGNLQFMTESTIDITFLEDGPSSAEAGQSSVTNTMAEDRAEVGTPTPLERLPEADAPPRIDVSQPEDPRGSAESPEEATPRRASTPVHHDPHPPFETDGRGRVVWSNSSEQAPLRSRSSPPVQPRKSSNDETTVTMEKENCGATSPEAAVGGCGGDNNGDGGRETGAEGAATGVP